ncbi:MAG: TetR/AcrR family transcriptional regulator [Bacteroidetes bacterium]|nr:MAG: TetR/AcrR family transcriptional regulator [Bacteroidota bacterium]
MKASNNHKERQIIEAAKKVFFEQGFQKTKMEDIAKAAACSKVTVYSYFESKENLYMAITYDAFQFLADTYYQSVEANKEKSGLESLLAIAKAYLDFCTKHAPYSDLIFNYRTIIRDSLAGEQMDKISEAMKSSIYYRKIRDIQFLPIKIATEEIKRGQLDGSITNDANPYLIHHLMWSNVVGFVNLNLNPKAEVFIQVKVQEWRAYILRIVKAVCLGKV